MTEEADFLGRGLYDLTLLAEESIPPSTTVLNLHCNALVSLSGLPLARLSSLQELNLSSNEFVSCDFPELSFLPSLRILDLSANRISSLQTLPFLPGLRSLVVAYNSLSSLSGVCADNVPHLESLDARGNFIAYLPQLKSLSTLPRLHTLLLGGRAPNPVCSSLKSLVSLFDDCAALQELDGQSRDEWRAVLSAAECASETKAEPTAENQPSTLLLPAEESKEGDLPLPPEQGQGLGQGMGLAEAPTPKFDQIAKRFKAQLQLQHQILPCLGLSLDTREQGLGQGQEQEASPVPASAPAPAPASGPAPGSERGGDGELLVPVHEAGAVYGSGRSPQEEGGAGGLSSPPLSSLPLSTAGAAGTAEAAEAAEAAAQRRLEQCRALLCLRTHALLGSARRLHEAELKAALQEKDDDFNKLLSDQQSSTEAALLKAEQEAVVAQRRLQLEHQRVLAGEKRLVVLEAANMATRKASEESSKAASAAQERALILGGQVFALEERERALLLEHQQQLETTGRLLVEAEEQRASLGLELNASKTKLEERGEELKQALEEVERAREEGAMLRRVVEELKAAEREREEAASAAATAAAAAVNASAPAPSAEAAALLEAAEQRAGHLEVMLQGAQQLASLWQEKARALEDQRALDSARTVAAEQERDRLRDRLNLLGRRDNEAADEARASVEAEFLARARELTDKVAAKEARWAANYEALSSLSSGQQGQILELSACVRRLRLALSSSQAKLKALEAANAAKAEEREEREEEGEGGEGEEREEREGKAEMVVMALEHRCREVEDQLREAKREAQDLRDRLALAASASAPAPAPTPSPPPTPASASASAPDLASLQQEVLSLGASLAQAKGREEERGRELSSLQHALAVKDALLRDQADALVELKARLKATGSEAAEEIRALKAALETEASDREASEAEAADLRAALEEAERQQELQSEVSERYQRLVAAMTSVSASVSFDASQSILGIGLQGRGSLSLSEVSRD